MASAVVGQINKRQRDRDSVVHTAKYIMLKDTRLVVILTSDWF